MPVPFNEIIYPAVKQWLSDNPQDMSIPEPIKQDLLRFEQLTEKQKEKLQTKLLALPKLPDVIQQFIPNYLARLPVELLRMIDTHLAPQDREALSRTSQYTRSIFGTDTSLQFLECVAYGQQDKAERLLKVVLKGQPERIQTMLLHQGKLTDYSGRTFRCSAYEYAYWAKDTHMCRMLEHYMDEETKAQMLVRINVNDADGLSFKQNGEEHRSAHFDFTELTTALTNYAECWTGDYDAIRIHTAILAVNRAQRNVPAHVAHEYCHPTRKFEPCPDFTEINLPRRFDLFSLGSQDYWFPLTNDIRSESVIIISGSQYGMGAQRGNSLLNREDLRAITRLDEVRTTDLAQSRENLKPGELFPNERMCSIS